MDADSINDSLHSKIYYIRYYPELNSAIGSQQAALIIDRLEYWFSKYKTGFYKFFEPCKCALYKKGDSWVEEIGIARRVFNKAFEHIGVKYKSKSEFHAAEDKFMGKLYASYYDRKTNRTYFIRNHAFANEFLNNLFKKKSSSTSSKQKNREGEGVQIVKEKSMRKGRSCNDQNSRSSRGTIGGIYTTKQKITFKSVSLEKEQDLEKNVSKLSSATKGIALKMIEVWKQEIGDTCLSFSSTTVLQILHSCLEEKFEGSLVKWQEYCQMINSSKFFMGEGYGKNFTKPYLLWAVKEATIEKIFNGMYSLGDRENNLDHEITLVKAEIQTLSDKKSQLEGEKPAFKFDQERERVSKARDLVEKLTAEELEVLRLEFKEDLRGRGEQFETLDEDNDACKKIFEIMFDRYLINLMQSKIYDVSIEEDQLYSEKASENEKKRSEVDNKLIMLNISLDALNEKKKRLTIKSQFEQEQDRERTITVNRIRECLWDSNMSSQNTYQSLVDVG